MSYEHIQTVVSLHLRETEAIKAVVNFGVAFIEYQSIVSTIRPRRQFLHGPTIV